MQPGKSDYEHYWDPLRALLMMLGIPYHASLLYSHVLPWDIKDFETSPLLSGLGAALVTFRMPTFFLVAGYFSTMVIGKKGKMRWLRQRFLRLGVPFIVAVLLLGPLQLFLLQLASVAKGNIPADRLLESLPGLLRPSEQWIMHLWFLPALIAYSVLLAALLFLAARPPFTQIKNGFNSLQQRRATLFFAALCALPVLWELMVYGSGLLAASSGSRLFLLYERASDPYARYLPFFLLGALLQRNRALFHQFRQTGFPTVVIAAGAIGAAVALRLQHPFSTSALLVLVSAIAAVAASRLLIDLACRYFDRPSPLARRMTDASFTIYLFHHPLIYAFGILFILIALPPILEFAIIVAATTATAYVLHQAIRRSPLALFLFNGIRRPRGVHDIGTQAGASQTLR
ncbi:glucans biosynthesis protein C [Agrobacterium fabrum]|uniref:glucans biosynthesis protein MdoC n=1 Tax=Agrobacterium fabrum TaxID=1176649 RepID=UPI000891C55D|nr:glucans biosynthesis protein MdoC [Agrobacterium fabrum]MDH6295091.1 glucan biosynthesis protein C [Agrobacterium fabrum]SDB62891.1 glucans biosynthesis protein C [Agrobacterium fabrum]SER24411.1 glucans biosynthesis protein C [Agrobacterium fabrum]